MSKILMVNGYSKMWKYIPMGTFGLCDFLSQRGIKSKIFNAAIYDKNEYFPKLKLAIDNYKPDYIGLIIHWKELLENCISLSYEIKRLFPDIKIVTGGITAGFMDKELLRRFESIDFLIKGDPENPLYLLITKYAIADIPNLIYRQNNKIKKNNSKYTIDKKTLNSISYAKLHYLIDNKKYIEQINNGLGFPIFIGRGCIYDCLFCGGSKKAFQAHSNNKNIVCRDIQYVIKDLKLILRYMDNIYIGYEVNTKYIYDLFTAILHENKISKKLRLNYGAWHLMDDGLIDLYSQAFKLDPKGKSTIEISPETSVDKDRRVIKDKSLYFNNKQMLQSIDLIQQKLSNSIMIQVFYSRYHKTQNNIEKLILELKNIHKFREQIYLNGWNNISINYSHLSTDVGSLYWDLALMNSKRNSIDLLLSIIKKQILPSPKDFRLGNLCIYYPKQLSKDVRFRYEVLIKLIDLMFRAIPDFYFDITKVLGFSKLITLLEDMINKYPSLKNTDKDADIVYLIDLLHYEIKRKYRNFYDKNPVFYRELFTLYIKYLNAKCIEIDEKQKCFIERPLLDKNKFYISNYNFINKQFYRSLNKKVNNIPREKTVNVFCSNRIYNFEYEYYNFFKLFNGKNKVNDILKVMANYNLTNFHSFISSYRYWFTI